MLPALATAAAPAGSTVDALPLVTATRAMRGILMPRAAAPRSICLSALNAISEVLRHAARQYITQLLTAYTGWSKKRHIFFVRLNFIEIDRSHKLISLSESGEHL